MNSRSKKRLRKYFVVGLEFLYSCTNPRLPFPWRTIVHLTTRILWYQVILLRCGILLCRNNRYKIKLYSYQSFIRHLQNETRYDGESFYKKQSICELRPNLTWFEMCHLLCNLWANTSKPCTKTIFKMQHLDSRTLLSWDARRPQIIIIIIFFEIKPIQKGLRAEQGKDFIGANYLFKLDLFS